MTAADGRAGHRPIWVAVALVVVLLVVVPLAVQAYGRLVQREETSAARYGGPVRTVLIEAGPARVDVGPGASREVTVRRTLRWSVHRPEVRAVRDGDVLRVAAGCAAASDLFHSLDCGIGLDVRVPPGAAVDVESGSGSIRMHGLAAGVRARVTSGSVELDGIRGRIDARAGSGSVTGTGLRPSSVALSVDSGSADLRFAAAPADVRASVVSGTGTLRFADGARYRVSERAHAGTLTVAPGLRDPHAPGALELTLGSGSLTASQGAGASSASR